MVFSRVHEIMNGRKIDLRYFQIILSHPLPCVHFDYFLGHGADKYYARQLFEVEANVRNVTATPTGGGGKRMIDLTRRTART